MLPNAGLVLPDLQHDLAAGVPTSDPASASSALSSGSTASTWGCSRTGIDQGAHRLQPVPVDGGGERFARDAALQLGDRALRTMKMLLDAAPADAEQPDLQAPASDPR
jgi:hypothetical protein